MPEIHVKPAPPDQSRRKQAIDPRRSYLVQAPAGSGKTTLLKDRFLCLLSEVEEPGQVLAITFTKAAAAEMRHRILDELRKEDPSSLASRALEHSQRLGWNLLNLPAQLRILTIDAFCREIALQQPLLSGLGGGLEISEEPNDLYRRAARRTLQQIGRADNPLSQAIEQLLLARDNNWQAMEDLLVKMLAQRDRWMHGFVLEREPNWDELRAWLERPFARAALEPARYSEDEWSTLRASFVLLRHAAAELQVIFAEAGAADFIEVAQIAQRVLRGTDGLPTEAAFSVCDGIRHLLVDEFQDTSRRQHQMLASLIAAWPERSDRTCFTVGDPMQSIYFFRGADAELFSRVKKYGIEFPSLESPPCVEFFPLDFVPLTANFRTRPALVKRLNEVFGAIFAKDDASGVVFCPADAARKAQTEGDSLFRLHIQFDLKESQSKPVACGEQYEMESALAAQTGEIISLIRTHMGRIDEARRLRARNEDVKYRVAILGRKRKELARIALALHEAAIPFRAVGLEPLKDRPEVLDALNLAHALLNAYDRVAWLGTLRAPWCGLALEDLHRLAGADDPAILGRPVPELLHERLTLLSEAGQKMAGRVLQVMQLAQRLRAEQPTSAVGSWLQQIWLRLGGAACVDAAGRANVDLLWQCLDVLPNGEQDLLSPVLNAALAKLTALPDPDADSECGVQLMTIHNSKGLEFEVVIVPELQAEVSRGEQRLLSWLERGLAEPDDSGDITEFLIAPLPRKGDKKGKAKDWVDLVYREREHQEARRLLYVASTRACEELHLFARPVCKRDRNGELQLQRRKNTLLEIAWPALGDEIEAQFAAWKAEQEERAVETLAASAEDNLIRMPAPDKSAAAPEKPTWLRRLPAEFDAATGEDIAPESTPSALVGMGFSRLYARHEGGLISRALGTAVHALLEELARLRTSHDWPASRAAIHRLAPHVAAQIRAYGLDPAQAAALAERALKIALDATHDFAGQWVLSPHAEAASEISWSGVVAGSMRTVRVDRVFQAGLSPGSEGLDCWWIIDYKTAHADDVDPVSALPELRTIFAPQLEAYAAVLRKLHGPGAHLHAGLYYPRMLLLDWWEPDA
jgi:ATP-dependent exoDNAse (exonuclease V) beta subunit